MKRRWLIPAVAIGCAVACGGTTSDRAGTHDHVDAGTPPRDGGAPDSDTVVVTDTGARGMVGSRCKTDDDCGSGLVCELDSCATRGSVAYPTAPAPPLFTMFPTTCFAPDLGMLEIRLAPPAGETGFGASVLLDGDRLAVGTATGVQTYRGNGLAWTEETFVPLPAHITENSYVTALSGDTLAVGSQYDTANPGGAVYVYGLAADGGSVSQVLVPSRSTLEFGSSVALNAQSMAVASTKSVVLFTRGSGGWSQTQEIVPDTPVPPAGLSAALYHDVLAVGAYWFLPNVNSEGSAVFVYRSAGGAFALEARIDDPVSADTAFGSQPGLSDGLLVAAGSSVYANGTAGWALEAQLGGGFSVIDGTRIASSYNGVDGVQLFERAGGTWPVTMTVKAHDVSTSSNFGGSLALRGNVLAVADSYQDGNGAFAGAAYTFTKTATSSSPDCALSATGPPRIEGVGTGCVEPGTGTAKCPYMAPGTSTVTGTTPDGAVSFPFAWADVVGGDTNYTTVVLSNVAPRREGTSPTISFTPQRPDSLQPGQAIPTSFTLTLCSRTVTVDGVLTLDVSGDAGQERGRLAGSIAIEHDGWSVKGTFRTVFCTWRSTH